MGTVAGAVLTLADVTETQAVADGTWAVDLDSNCDTISGDLAGGDQIGGDCAGAVCGDTVGGDMIGGDRVDNVGRIESPGEYTRRAGVSTIDRMTY